MALNISFFEDLAAFGRRLDRAIEEVQQSGRRDGVNALFAPGNIEDQIAEDYVKNGIVIAAETAQGIRDVAQRLGLTPSELPFER
jgi:LDH2 family malate/lactate/ureidoglycolate dehydrogenase